MQEDTNTIWVFMDAKSLCTDIPNHESKETVKEKLNAWNDNLIAKKVIMIFPNINS